MAAYAGREALRGLTAALIEGCGHIIAQHRPEALLALLEPFLAAR